MENSIEPEVIVELILVPQELDMHFLIFNPILLIHVNLKEQKKRLKPLMK